MQEVPSDGVGDMEEVERRYEGCVSGQRLWACTWQKEGTQPCRLTEEGACRVWELRLLRLWAPVRSTAVLGEQVKRI